MAAGHTLTSRRPGDLPGPWAMGARVVMATAVVLGLAATFGERLVQWLLPALLQSVQFSASDFRILDLRLIQEGPDRALEARAVLNHVILMGGRAVVPNGRTGLAVTTTLGTLLQPIMAAAVLVLAWPARPLEALLRLVFGLLLLLPVVLWLDAPLYLSGSLWQMHEKVYEPGTVSMLVSWKEFLAGGGHLALGLLAGVLAIGSAAALTGRERAPTGSEPASAGTSASTHGAGAG